MGPNNNFYLANFFLYQNNDHIKNTLIFNQNDQPLHLSSMVNGEYY